MATCYIAEGADMPEFVPCNTTANVSLCCIPGQICLSNGYCSTQYGQIYSGACTDPTYSSSICPEFCTMATGGYIARCEGSATQNERYCCSMHSNRSCCDDPNNKLHMAPPISSAIAMMPAIAKTAASSTRMTTSSMDLPFSITVSSTSHSTQISLNSALSTTAITPTATPTPKSDGKMKKLGIGLGVGLGVVALALLLWGIHEYHRRRERREKYHQALARAQVDAWNTANRAHARNRTENPAHGERGVGSSAESAKTESIPMRGHMLASSEAANRSVQTLATSEAVPTIVRALTSPGAVNTRVQTLATSETVPTIARTLVTSEASLTRAHTLGWSEGDTGSRPASGLPTALPNSPIEREELATDSPADAEPTPELGPDTSGSDTSDSDTSKSEQHNATPLQPTTSTRSKTATPAQMDGTLSPSPDTDMMTRVPTAERGSRSHNEPAQDEATAPAKPTESLQVEDEVERQWSWQQGDDEHLQRSLEARVGLDEQVQHVQESPEAVMESEQ